MPPPPWILRWPVWLGALSLAGAVGLLATAPQRLDQQTLWWNAWLGCAGALLFAYPLTMLLQRRNRHSRQVFRGLALQSLALLLLAAGLLLAVHEPR